jgi:aminoglycoside phosphotransferase
MTASPASRRKIPEQVELTAVAAAPAHNAAPQVSVVAAHPNAAPASLDVSLETLMSRPGIHPVLLAGSRDPNAKLTMMLIDECGPAFAVKIATTDASAVVVRSEGQLLAALHNAGLGALAASVPRPVGFVTSHDLPALVTGALSGTPMAVSYHAWRHTARRRTVRADFDAAAEWLAGLHRRTAGDSKPVTMLAESLNRIEERFGKQRQLRSRLSGPANRLARQVTPRTAVHGDYWFGNILIDKKKVVGVVDWEAGAFVGEPLRDVARFAVSYALYLDRHVASGASIPGHRSLRASEWGVGLTHAANGPGWFNDVALSFCAAALARLGANPACARDLILAGIADVAATADHPEFARSHLDLLRRLDPEAMS